MQLDIALAAAGVGLVLGLTGMGGGALMTPMLVLGFGVPALTAVSSDLVASAVMKPIGGAVHLRHGTVIVLLVKWLIAGSVPAAFASVLVVRQLVETERVEPVLNRALGLALLLAAGALVSRAALRRRTGALGQPMSIEVRPLRTLAIGVFGGVVVGLTSVGSGSLMMVLLLILYPTITAAQLVGTDFVGATPLVVAAALAHLVFGDVDWALTGSILLGAVPTVLVGAHLSSRAPDHLLRPLLAVMLGGIGLRLLGVPTPLILLAAVPLLVALAGRRTWRRALGHRTELEAASSSAQ